MNPLIWVRVVGVAVVLAALYGGYQYIHHDGVVQGRDEVQKKFDAYKENINDQVQKANAKAAADKAEQDAKYAKAQGDYATTRKQLAAALARLRKSEAVPGDEGVPVAGCGTGSMRTETTDTSGTTPAVEVTAGACEGTEFWENALKDTLQCEALINFVK